MCHPATSPIALPETGFEDGFPAGPDQRGFVIRRDRPDIKLPIIGRISMDSRAVNLTPLIATGTPQPPVWVVLGLIGPHAPLDEVAHLADTIGYETSDGPRGLRPPSPLRSPERMKA